MRKRESDLSGNGDWEGRGGRKKESAILGGNLDKNK